MLKFDAGNNSVSGRSSIPMFLRETAAIPDKATASPNDKN